MRHRRSLKEKCIRIEGIPLLLLTSFVINVRLVKSFELTEDDLIKQGISPIELIL